MYKLFGTFLMLLYSIQALLCPLQDVSSLKYLPQTYDQCKSEDPDMDIADFVFEHLMNFDVLLSCFDKDTDEKNEKPHHPVLQLQSLCQAAIVVSKPITIIAPPSIAWLAKVKYPASRDISILTDYLDDIFRPPSV